MKLAMFAALFASLCSVRSLQAQALSDSEVEAAIKAGVGGNYKSLRDTCAATPGFGESLSKDLAGGVQDNGGFAVVVSSTAGQIASLAADAKRLYEPFTLDKVSAELRERA
jgi:hypothetical protein